MLIVGYLESVDVFHTHDSKVIGEYVGFTISSIGGYAI